MNMSAYIVIEGVVRDKEALARYGSQATPLIKQFGGEILAFGPWEVIYGEAAYHKKDYIQSYIIFGTAMRYSTQIKPISYLKANAAEVLRVLEEQRKPISSRKMAKPRP
jgi:hypothetical protein